jgi:urea transporter
LAATAALRLESVAALAVVAVGVAGSVLVTGALRSALGTMVNLPPLSLPFIVVTHLVWGAASTLGVDAHPLAEQLTLFGLTLPQPISLYLRSLGAIFLMPRVDSGLFVCAALLVHSRIGWLLSLVGFAVASLFGLHLGGAAEGMLPVLLGFNFILTAIALGGVWFVPSIASTLFAAAGTLLCGLVSLGLLPVVSAVGLPLLILPFNVTVILALYAMRQRVEDRSPKSVDFLLGTPEENLNYYRTRLARFWLALSRPLLGAVSRPVGLHAGGGWQVHPPGPMERSARFRGRGPRWPPASRRWSRAQGLPLLPPSRASTG